MFPVNIFALTRIEDEKRLRRLERQMSGRGRFLSIKEWETKGLKLFCSRLCSVYPEATGLKFFYSFTMPKLGKEFDLLRVCESSVINVELKSGNVSDAAILHQLTQNKYYLATLGRSMYFYTYVSDTDRLVRLTGSGRLIEAEWEELAAVLKGQENVYEGAVEDLFKEEDYLISPLTDPGRFLRGEYFLTSQQRDIRRHILERVLSQNASIRRAFTLTAFTGLPGTGKSILLYDIAMRLSKRETVCVLHIGSYEKELSQLDTRLKRVDFYYCDIQKPLPLLKEYAAVLIDEGHRLNERLYEEILTYAKEKQIPVIAACDKEDALPREQGRILGGRLLTETEGCVSFKLTNRIRLNSELSSFIATLMRIRGREHRTAYPSVSLAFANDGDEAAILLQTFENEGYQYIYDGPAEEFEKLEKSVGITEAVCKEYDRVLMLLDESFYYDGDGYLRQKPKERADQEESGVRKLYHGLSRAKKKIAIVVKANPQVFDGILSILQGE